MIKRKIFTQIRSDTLPMGCLHRKDFPTKSGEIKSPQLQEDGKGEIGIYPSSRLIYPCYAIIITLILNGFGYYDKIMNMSFESGIYTYITAAL